MSTKPRVLFIGLDAADRELVDRWEGEGLLPNISRMKRAGAWGSIRTTADVLHVSAWPSIFTGTEPDKHGLYHAYVMQPGVQAPVRPRPDLCPVPWLWKTLDEHGKRCIVIDAFLTCPLKNFGGVQLVDWGSWTWFWQQTILPLDLAKEVSDRFGPYPAEDHSKVGMTPPPDPEGFRQRLLAGVAKKAEVAKWLMTSQDWDFFLVVFGESHPAGHYFWHYQDPAYIAHPKTCPDTLRNALRDVYVALDRAIGELLDTADANTLVCLFAGDGMGPNYSGSHLLAPLLEKMSMLNAPAAAGAPGAAPPRAKKSLLSTLRGLVPKQLRALVSRWLLPRSVNQRLSLHWKTAGIAWDRTKAFVIENANEGFVRVNLKGREPQGTVEPGAAYDNICREVSETARALVNPANGKPAAHAVHCTDDLYSGPCRSVMPDVIIAWDPEAKVTTDMHAGAGCAVHSDQAGYEITPYYTGNHRPNAFGALVGPGVSAGSSIEGISILDVAPSLLRRFGIEPLAHMDGKPIAPLTGHDVKDSAA